jgi:hypothetical protein
VTAKAVRPSPALFLLYYAKMYEEGVKSGDRAKAGEGYEGVKFWAWILRTLMVEKKELEDHLETAMMRRTRRSRKKPATR